MQQRAHIIVVGNEKGGAGKTTTTIHLITNLLTLGFSVSSIDVDCRQLSLTRYLENRRRTMEARSITLPCPNHAIIKRSPFDNIKEADEDETSRMEQALEKAMQRDDFIVIDTPGSDSALSRAAHSYADTIITPINDSFIDLDVLARVEGDTLNVERPGIYSQMIWEQKINRAKRDRGVIDWIVLRNRLATIDARNKRTMTEVLAKVSQRLGFRQAAGFGERVIYRELFLQGLTLLDVVDERVGVNLSMSHVAARQELRTFLTSLNIPRLTAKLKAEMERELVEEDVKEAVEA